MKFEKLSSVSYQNSLSWEVAFFPANRNDILNPTKSLLPAPFNEFFPVATVSENILSISEYGFQNMYSNYSIPQKSSELVIDISFYNDENNYVLNYITDWINKDILGDGKYVSPLKEIVKCLAIRKYSLEPNPESYGNANANGIFGYQGQFNNRTVLEHKKINVSSKYYLVYPTGSINWDGDSDGQIPTYSLQFHIAGELNKNEADQIVNRLTR